LDFEPISIIRSLERLELDAAIEVFAQAIPRYWPNTSEEARLWVKEEFYHPEAVVIGHFDRTTLDAVVCLTSFEFVLSHLEAQEQALVEAGVAEVASSINPREVVHIGGLAVAQDAVDIGWGMLLFTVAEREAQNRGYKLRIGHTARRSEKYPAMRVLTSLVKWRKWQELPVSEKIYYANPPDLEKVWCYKPC